MRLILVGLRSFGRRLTFSPITGKDKFSKRAFVTWTGGSGRAGATPHWGLRRLRLILVCLRSFGRRLTFSSITGSTMACGQSPLRPLTPSCTTQTGQATPRAQRHLRQLPLLPNNRHHSRPVLSKHACGVVTSSTRTAVIFVLLSRCLAWPCDLVKPVNSKSRRHGAPLRFLKSGHTTFNPLCSSHFSVPHVHTVAMLRVRPYGVRSNGVSSGWAWSRVGLLQA